MAEKEPKKVLVTGGGRGIGRAIAAELAFAGHEVWISGRDSANLSEVAKELGVQCTVCDLSDRNAVDQLCSKIAPVEVLVNNAGLAKSAPLAKVRDSDWDSMMEVNAAAPLRLCRALVPHMVRAGWGRVINIASNAGLTGYRYSSVYCATKHALIGLTRALAAELATTGVTVNAVCPGWTRTDLTREAVARISQKTGRNEEEARQSLISMTPQKRLIEPQEIGHVVAMLVAESAGAIHGQSIVVDGGQVMQ